MSAREHTLDQGEAHPSNEYALQQVKRLLSSSVESKIRGRANKGDRAAQIALSTIARLQRQGLAGDRYVMGLCLYLQKDF